uniref:Thromboxane A2 receptor n=1 Tax=Scleropages formosus TaxID=113540 RepID=A0A8C9VHV5_SCLFO
MASSTPPLLEPSSAPSPPGQQFPTQCPYPRPLNGSCGPLSGPPTMGVSCLTMALGALSNLAALVILAKSRSRSRSRFRRRARTPFLLLTGALLLTDLAGHVIPGALALRLHAERLRDRGEAMKPAGLFCQLFGACMVFFGLCPLLLGGAMAAERCLGITRPLLHSAAVTATRARLTVALLSGVALLLAVLPLVAVGRYTPQFPGTWCFLPVHGPLAAADAALLLAFSALGLLALTFSLLCNTTSGLVLLLRARRSRGIGTRPHGCVSSSSSSSLDLEMMGQLGAITTVSCVCWCPLLIFILVSVGQCYQERGQSAPEFEQLVLLGLRMASWNQVLDPWIYILLRRTCSATISNTCLRKSPHAERPGYEDSHFRRDVTPWENGAFR